VGTSGEDFRRFRRIQDFRRIVFLKKNVFQFLRNIKVLEKTVD